MSAALLITFNVLVSAALSFVGAAALTGVGARLLRLRDGRARLAIALLPFAKLAVELARGVPSNAFFWLKLHEGARQELGGFRVGLGTDRLSPVLQIALSAQWRGAVHPQSGADLIASLLSRRVGPWAPGAIAAVLVVVGAALAAAFVVRLARSRRAARLESAEVIEVRDVGLRRRATVVASHEWHGVPFAAGVLRPIVCLPADVASQLSSEEREAVVAHELGHVRGLHAIVVGVVGVLERVLWFVPGAGWVAREARAQCEVAADDSAVRSGVDRAVLASALVRVAELSQARGPAPLLALFERRSVLSRRVSRLLEGPVPRPWHAIFFRLLGAAVLTVTVLRATILGNP